MARAAYATYKVTVDPGQTVRLAVAGVFVACISANLPEFRLALDDDPRGAFAQGFELRRPEGYTQIVIYNPSVVALVATIAAGSGEFTDRRLLTNRPDGINPVTVSDIAGAAYIVAASVSPAVGAYSQAQIYNPMGSGRLVVVRRMLVSSPAAGTVAIKPYDYPVTGLNGQSLYIGQPGSVGVLHGFRDTSIKGGTNLLVTYVQANMAERIEMESPFILAEGKGINVLVAATNTALNITAETIEVDG